MQFPPHQSSPKRRPKVGACLNSIKSKSTNLVFINAIIRIAHATIRRSPKSSKPSVIFQDKQVTTTKKAHIKVSYVGNTFFIASTHQIQQCEEDNPQQINHMPEDTYTDQGVRVFLDVP